MQFVADEYAQRLGQQNSEDRAINFVRVTLVPIDALASSSWLIASVKSGRVGNQASRVRRWRE